MGSILDLFIEHLFDTETSTYNVSLVCRMYNADFFFLATRLCIWNSSLKLNKCESYFCLFQFSGKIGKKARKWKLKNHMKIINKIEFLQHWGPIQRITTLGWKEWECWTIVVQFVQGQKHFKRKERNPWIHISSFNIGRSCTECLAYVRDKNSVTMHSITSGTKKVNKKLLAECAISRVILLPWVCKGMRWGRARGANQLLLYSGISCTVCHWFSVHKGHRASISQHAAVAGVDPDSSAMKRETRLYSDVQNEINFADELLEGCGVT